MAAVNVRLNRFGTAILLVALLCAIFYWFGGLQLIRPDSKISMKQLLCVSIDLAKRGGLRVKEIRESNRLQEKSKGQTKEGAKEMLTEGDLQSHRAIVYGFAKAFPGLQVISEEHETKTIDFKNIPDPLKSLEEVDEVITDDEMVSLRDITVWVDPLDATQEYTEDLTQYVTTLVGIAVRGQPTIGVIHQPFEKQTAWAWVNYGHSPTLAVAKPAAGDEKAEKRIIVSRSHAGKVEAQAKEAFGPETKVIPAGGAGYKTLAVIHGKAEAYVHVTLIKKWDICAGNALLSAVGGSMTALDGTAIDYSAEAPVKLEKGLLATLTKHDVYREKLAPVAEELQQEQQQQRR